MNEPHKHCQDEVTALDLLKEVRQTLAKAIDSLGNKTPPSQEAAYIFNPAVGINRAAEGYHFLRSNFRVHASKLLVRPCIESMIYATAAAKSKDFLFRKAFTEWHEDKRLMAKTLADQHEADRVLADLEQSFAKDLPEYPRKREKLRIKDAAIMAGLEHLYDVQFAIYCQYTHGSLRALSGELDPATDPRDTLTVCWCVLMILDLLKEHTPAEMPELVPFKTRLLTISGLRPEEVK